MIFRKIRKISVIFMKFAENEAKSTRFRPKFRKILPEFQQIVDDYQKSIDFADILENILFFFMTERTAPRTRPPSSRIGWKRLKQHWSMLGSTYE